jgi:hypothetical protein
MTITKPHDEPPARRWKGLCRVKFLAHLPVIRAALAEGWSAKHVYEHYGVAEAMSYRHFTRYISRLPDTGVSLVPMHAVPVQRRKPKPPMRSEPSHETAMLRQFTYDPKSLDKDDLI